MPWGSWVTCEETVNGPDVGPDFTGASNVTLTKPHGYVFEVPASVFPGEGQSSRQPIRSAGRFAHEAVSYDPESGYLYLTEDDFGFASGFYRYKPPSDPMVVGRLEDGGTLEMLKVVGVHNAHLEGRAGAGRDVPHRVGPDRRPGPGLPLHARPDRPDHQQRGDHPRRAPGVGAGCGVLLPAGGAGGPRRRRLLHLHPGRGSAGGDQREPRGLRTRLRTGVGLPRRLGQAPVRLPVLRPARSSTCPTTSRRRRAARSWCARTTPATTTSGACPKNGKLWDIALNPTNDEFAGSTFSPGGETLFVNIQASRGRTFAIWGPWHQIGV